MASPAAYAVARKPFLRLAALPVRPDFTGTARQLPVNITGD